MKTNFLPKNRKSAPYRKQLIVLVLVLAVGGFAVTILKQPIELVAGPIWQGSTAVTGGFRTIASYFTSKASLEKENRELKDKLASYDNLVLSARAVIDSRDALTETFGRASTSGIAVGVLVRPPQTMYDSLVLDAGIAEGVQVGNHVRLPEGGLVGIVTESFDHTSKATLYTSGGEETAAVLERGLLPVTLLGQGGGEFAVDVPRGITVVVGDKVLSPELDGDLVGVVRDVSSKSTDSSQHVLIESVEDLFHTRFFLVTP